MTKKIFFLMILFFFSNSVFAAINEEQLAQEVQTKIEKNGRERAKFIYQKLEEKVNSLSPDKQGIAYLLISKFENNLFDKIIDRSEATSQYKWDFSQIYQNETEFDADCQKMDAMLENLKKYESLNTGDNSQILQAMSLIQEISQKLDKLDVYAYAQKAVDTKNTHIDLLSQKVQILRASFEEKTANIYLKLKTLTDEKIDEIMSDEDFKDYKIKFDQIKKQKSRMLSQEAQDVINIFLNSNAGFSNIYSNLIDGDLVYPTLKDPQGNTIFTNYSNFYSAMNNTDRMFRQTFLGKMYNTYIAYKNTLSSIFISNLKEKTAYAKINKYNSVLDSVYENQSVPDATYDNLINVSEQNLDTLHRYIKLRKEILGLDKIHYYDMFVPISSKARQRFDYQDAENMILSGLSILGNEYLSGLRQAFENRRIDVYPDANKVGGAFCTSIYDLHPFLLINFANTYDGVSTLSHELGHAINFYLSANNEPYNLSLGRFTAEIPSITNELLLSKQLARDGDDDYQKLFYLDRYMELLSMNYRRATMYADFERQMYNKVWENEPLNSDSLDKTFENLFKKYYGDDFEYDDYLSIERAIKPHFFNTYYMHEYAISAAVANYIVQNIYSDAEGFKGKYINFLKSGGEGTPAEMLGKLGVDMNKSDYLLELSKSQNEIMDEMEEILSRIKK